MSGVKELVAEQLRELYQCNEVACAMFGQWADHGHGSKPSIVTSIYNQLVHSGRAVCRADVVQVFGELESIGIGQFVVGRRGKPSRFEWKASPKSVGKVARGDAEGVVWGVNSALLRGGGEARAVKYYNCDVDADVWTRTCPEDALIDYLEEIDEPVVEIPVVHVAWVEMDDVLSWVAETIDECEWRMNLADAESLDREAIKRALRNVLDPSDFGFTRFERYKGGGLEEIVDKHNLDVGSRSF